MRSIARWSMLSFSHTLSFEMSNYIPRRVYFLAAYTMEEVGS